MQKPSERQGTHSLGTRTLPAALYPILPCSLGSHISLAAPTGSGPRCRHHIHAGK